MTSGSSLEIAREMLGGFLERSILGHDGDRRFAPVEPPVQPGAENIVLQTDLAWIQEGVTVGRTGTSRIEEARPAVVNMIRGRRSTISGTKIYNIQLDTPNWQ